MASVRAIVPGQITDEQLFQPLTAALERYPKESYEVIIGAAGKVDTASKTVLVSLPGSSRSLSYDQLVVATGSRSTTSTVPWKILDSYDETVSNLDATRERVKEAKHIVVAGAGATGIEVAGELGCEYGKDKEVLLLSGGPSLLDGDSVGPAALAELKKLHVNVRFDARVTGSKELPDGKTEVALQNGEAITTDLYLPTMGMRANSEMMDQSYLTDKGYVSVDEFYRVKGLEKEGVWALGDVVSVPRGGFLFTQKQVSSLSGSPHCPVGCVTDGGIPGCGCRKECGACPPGQGATGSEADAGRYHGMRRGEEQGRRQDGASQDVFRDGVVGEGEDVGYTADAGLHQRQCRLGRCSVRFAHLQISLYLFIAREVLRGLISGDALKSFL